MASEHKFPIVGIGASAGGLEALEGLFRSMPPDTGLSFALVTHLARGHVSSLVEKFPGLIDAAVRPSVDPSAILLVRPDGYVACTAKADNVGVVADYLKAIVAGPGHT